MNRVEIIVIMPRAVKLPMMPTSLRIPATIAICFAAGACMALAVPDSAALAQAERKIRLQWQNNPKRSYHSLSYKGTLRECMAGQCFVQTARTIQGTWISIQELPPETLVFRGEVKGFHQVKTKGGAGYFFCSPESGELVAYLLMK